VPLIRGKQVAIWNADFDKRILAEEAEHQHLSVPMYRPVCLMRLYMAIVTEGRYRLQDACEHFGIEPSNHRATTDAEVTRQLLLQIVNWDRGGRL
jgi:DNA polymerase III epsilon subunit-like protein